MICWRKNWFEKTYFNNQDIENLEIKRPGKFDDFHLARKVQINDVFCDNFSHTNKSWLTVLQKKNCPWGPCSISQPVLIMMMFAAVAVYVVVCFCWSYN